MLKITLQPIKEFIIHNVIKSASAEALAIEKVTPNGNMPLFWANGVLFTPIPLQPSELITKEFMDGKVHWAELHYFPLKEYVDKLEVGSIHSVPVLDFSNSDLGRELANFIEQNFKG